MVQLKNLLPEGVDTIYGDEYAFKDELMNNIKGIFKSFGYRQILTPTFEYLDLYKETFSGINVREMFKFISAEGDIMVLRPDATIPVSRIAAKNYKDIDHYLKFSYVTNVFRQMESQKGDRKEFLQGGIEFFGNPKPDCDAEVIAIGIKALIDCGIEDLHLDLGQVQFLGALLEEAEPDNIERKRIIELIESKNHGELKTYLAGSDLDEQYKTLIYEIPKLYGTPAKILDKARGFAINEGMNQALDNLEKVYQILKDYGYDNYIIFDLGFTNPLDYYTGTVFKGYVNNFGKPLIQGGRYDSLTGKFGAEKPACGFGMNINNLVEVVNMYQAKDRVNCYTDYLVLYKDEFRAKALTLSLELREKGYIVETDSYDASINGHLGNANFRNTREIIDVCGEMVKVVNVLKNDVVKVSLNQFISSVEPETLVLSIH